MPQNSQTKTKQKPITVNGRPMPFSADELIKVLNIIKKSFMQAEEQLDHQEEEKVIDHLLVELA